MYLSHLKYVQLWNPQVRSVSSRKQLKLGSTYETESSFLGMTIRASNHVTAFISDQEFQVENATGTIQYVVHFKISNKDQDSVILTSSTTVSSESKAFVFTKPILKSLVRRELQTDLQSLKLAVEHKLHDSLGNQIAHQV
jgi:hypothetical protein